MEKIPMSSNTAAATNSHDLTTAPEAKESVQSISPDPLDCVVTIGSATLYLGDSADVLPLINEVDACVTDPPYGLSFMGKAWDYEVPQTPLWKLVNKTLKPGAHLLAFFGSRTYHRGVVKIEDAGFHIRDQLMWLYGSGFPKSHNVGKAIEAQVRTGSSSPKAQRLAAMGDAYEPTPLAGTPEYGTRGNMFRSAAGGRTEWDRSELDLTVNEAKEWQGWGTALKPAHEPIVLARKPLSEPTVAKNVLKHRTGALNIDASRVGSAGGSKRSHQKPYPANDHGGADRTHWARTGHDIVQIDNGRWPANVITDGSNEVLDQFPKVKTSGPSKRKRDSGNVDVYGNGIGDKAGSISVRYAEEGSAARFFYCAKPSKKERGEGNLHPTVKPTALMRYLCRLATPPGGVVLDPFMGSGTAGVAAVQQGFRFIGIERDPEYFEIACARIAEAQGIPWNRAA